ncbi:MAG: TIGR02679 family protein, partial [Pseudomonadota bacterium]
RAPPRWTVAGRDVFVCENPNLLAIVADTLGSRSRPLVCTDGMPAAAQRTLLRQLVAAGARLHYHGDFDWPGIKIGNHLIRSYGARPWRFGIADYLAAARSADGRGRTLGAGDVEACWDAALAPAMRERNLAIDEEAVAMVVVADLEVCGLGVTR